MIKMQHNDKKLTDRDESIYNFIDLVLAIMILDHDISSSNTNTIKN